MITKTITAANQWSNPMFIAHNERPIITVREMVVPLVATVTIQKNDSRQSSAPGTSDSGWHTICLRSVTGEGKVETSLPGNAWYRVGVATGAYASGTAEITINTQSVG